MKKCSSCKTDNLIFISGTYGHVLLIEKQYYLCICCGDRFEMKIKLKYHRKN